MTLLLMAVAAFVTRDAWQDMFGIAMKDDESSQVMLAPVVAIWLFWVRRERLRGYRPSARWFGPVLVGLGWTLHWFGDAYLYQSIWHFGAILIVVGAALSVLGGGLLIRFGPAFLALAFLVPVPGIVRQNIAIPLQTASAEITKMVLETLGASVERIGNTLRINEQDVQIAEACNGIRMAFALLMVSFAFAYGTPLRNGIRVLVVALSPVTAIVFNVFRLAPLVWSIGFFPEDVAQTIHDVSAWVMLPVAFGSLLLVMRLLRWAQVPITPYVLAHGS